MNREWPEIVEAVRFCEAIFEAMKEYRRIPDEPHLAICEGNVLTEDYKRIMFRETKS